MAVGEDNSFWRDVSTRLEGAERYTSRVNQTWDAVLEGWSCPSRPALATPPALLAGRSLAVDVTDRGTALYPIGLGGRFHIDVGFDCGAAGHTWTDDPARARRLVTSPGRAILVGTGWTVTYRVCPHLPLLTIALRVTAACDAVIPELVWAGPSGPRSAGDGLWLRPQSFAQDEVIERNNSRIPDPLPPEGRVDAGVGIALVAGAATWRDLGAPFSDQRLLAGRSYRARDLRGVSLSAQAGAALTVAVGVCASPEEFLATLQELADDPRGTYWAAIGRRLRVHLPDVQIERQCGFSVHNSLFSRASTDGGYDVFIHGRRDRGYADAAHLHQSYQMHLPALLAGEGHSVRDDVRAHLALQRADGWLESAPRPGAGYSTYVGLYTNAHILMAVHRYLAWTGDVGVLGQRIPSRFDPTARTVLERARRAGTYLLEHRTYGLVQPCGWADAWNPAVRAQAQVSCAAVIGLRELAEILEFAGDSALSREYRDGADEIADAVTTRCLDPQTGLVAEHVFDDGTTGGSSDDFFSFTQIWAALAGVTADTRGLEHVRAKCWDLGVAAAPATAFTHRYLADSTDSQATLSVESTATWLLARWPELTHLCALAWIRADQPDLALAAILSQLPERLHRRSPRCPPYFYAEKYLYPGTRPWLATWAGDPTLIEVVACGFLGITAGLDALHIQPRLPSAWHGQPWSAALVVRGRRLRLHGKGDTLEISVNGHDMAASRPLDAAARRPGSVVRVPWSQFDAHAADTH